MKIQQLSRHESDFQQPVDEEDLRRVLGEELGGETVAKVVELQAGLFNTTFRIESDEGRYILKVAPEAGAEVFYNERYLMEREETVAETLCSLSPLIPGYHSFFKVDGRTAFLQPFIDGRLWHDEESSLTASETAALWKQLGAFAKVLHDCQGKQFGYPGPLPGFNRWSEFIHDNVQGMVADCHRLGVFSEEIETYCRLLQEFLPALDEVTTPHLCHGDLWPRNVLFQGAGDEIRLSAVFDAERAFWGDPVSDWVLILYELPEKFWEGYGKNLLESSNPTRIAIYKGMYFILNILETTRFKKSAKEPRRWLSGINLDLARSG